MQGFESVIEDALGINDNNTLAPLEQTFAFILEEGIFRVHTNWSAVFTQVAKFDLNLDVLKSISGLTDFLGFEDIDQLTDSVNLEAASQVNELAEIDAVIDVGIVLQSLQDTPATPEIFVYDYDESTGEGTRFILKMRVQADRLNLSFKAGQFTFGVDGGDVVLDGDGEAYTNDYADMVTVDHQVRKLGHDNGRLGLTEDLANSLEWSLTGVIDIDLPLELSTGTASAAIGLCRLAATVPTMETWHYRN